MIKLDGKVKKWIGVGAALIAAAMAFGDELADRQRDEDIEDMKKDIAELKKSKEQED